MLIGGDADRFWDSTAARATGKTVVEIVGADHALRVPGPIRAYTDTLATIGKNIEKFLEMVRSGQF